MSVWVTIPSARTPEEVEVWAKAWRERGYKIAILRDDPREARFGPHPFVDYQIVDSLGYKGYAQSVNRLIADIMHENSGYPQAEWFIAAGDDIFPDPNKSAEEIAQECRMYFAQLHAGPDAAAGVDLSVKSIGAALRGLEQSTFGVMQPTADRWGEDPNAANPKHRSAYIDRVCGSAWIGREFARRINQGRGPLWPEYFHMSVDRELQGVAQKYGVLWQRPDLTHFHQHWGRPKPGERIGHASNMPAFLKKANEGMTESEKLCDQRERDGFPGSEPL